MQSARIPSCAADFRTPAAGILLHFTLLSAVVSPILKKTNSTAACDGTDAAFARYAPDAVVSCVCHDQVALIVDAYAARHSKACVRAVTILHSQSVAST